MCNENRFVRSLEKKRKKRKKSHVKKKEKEYGHLEERQTDDPRRSRGNH